MFNLDSLKWIHPYYDNNKKCTLKGDWKGISGIYLLKEKDKIIYIGMSLTNLKKTCYRHFQKWNDYRYNYYPIGVLPPYKRPTYENREDFQISVIIVENHNQCLDLEKYLIQTYQPIDNREKYLLYKKDDENIKQIKKNSYFLEDIEENIILEEAPF
jgi:excinuclease UvrABC nuclease subunit